MRLPQKKKPGDPVMAEDWNLLLDAVAARTPRPGDGLKFISSSGGFAYAAPKPVDSSPGQPPFSVIGIARSGGGYKVTIKEGWVIERQPKTGSKPAVKFHMPEDGGTPLDSIPKPEIQMSLGDTLWCRVQTDDEGIITGKPLIIVSSGDKDGNHYYPEDPEGSGQPGDCYVKLLALENDGGSPRVKVYQQSDIEHWAQLWTGKNNGGYARVFKEHKEDDNTYRFRSLKGIAPITVDEKEDEIEFSFGGGIDLNIIAYGRTVTYSDGYISTLGRTTQEHWVIAVRNGVVIGHWDTKAAMVAELGVESLAVPERWVLDPTVTGGE